jgi:hypothetical protein
MPARVVVLQQRLKHVGHDAGDLLDIVGRERTTNRGVGLHAKTLHAESESPFADVQNNDARGRVSIILVGTSLSRQSAFCRFGGIVSIN